MILSSACPFVEQVERILAEREPLDSEINVEDEDEEMADANGGGAAGHPGQGDASAAAGAGDTAAGDGAAQADDSGEIQPRTFLIGGWVNPNAWACTRVCATNLLLHAGP